MDANGDNRSALSVDKSSRWGKWLNRLVSIAIAGLGMYLLIYPLDVFGMPFYWAIMATAAVTCGMASIDFLVERFIGRTRDVSGNPFG